ncbi:MAG: T9SS type A sorting domain-containing protein [Puia sp.]|nr:T9SS type A sorting domain-containing protein [Puia sp.]
MKTIIPVIACRCKTLGLLLYTLFFLYGKSSAQAPANDLCANATVVTSAATCSTIPGTLKGATASTGIATNCGNASSPDVWYSFTANSPFPTISLTGVGLNFTQAGVRMQLFSGTCGSFTSLACVSGNSLNTLSAVGGSGLTIGTVYYIRIYSNAASSSTGNTWGFNICITDQASPTIDYGKSYLNISKGNSGGTVQPGDTLEIRATFVVKANTAYACSFTDNIPANTTYLPGTIRILTNEGKIYKQLTDASDGDGGTLSGTAVTINFGNGATATTGGNVANTNKPSFYGGTCIIVASYRVLVNASNAYGTIIDIGNGTFQYNKYSTGGPATQIVFPSDPLAVYYNYGICSNTAGNNALISEYGGTFGSGNAKDRVASSKVPGNYTYATFSSTAGMPNDDHYGVSNNTSGGTTTATGYSTSNAYAYPDNSLNPSHRIFSVWDIIGDHTGAANPLLGNPATDDNAGASGGYMVVINANYKTDTAYLDTVSNLCPNTYYQYTAWFRNICSKCGCDSNGVGATSSGYIPTATGDSSGVHPNLTFNINGYDYYTTGNILYTGQWVQKGFTYLTGPNQTSMVINIRNDAPGGGGNDWAIDDIGVATCSPNMVLTPNKPDTLCQGSDDTVRFKVVSFFNNYTQWMLQQSTDGGSTWTSPGNDTLGNPPSGVGTPVYNSTSGQYEYLVTRYFRIPQATGNTIIKYRIIIASSVDNLSNANCSFITLTPKIINGVNCMIALPTNIRSFTGRLDNGYAALQWVSTNEVEGVSYIVERSSDQTNFTAIGTVSGTSSETGAAYHFNDPTPLNGPAYYRINITSNNYHTYSNTILLSTTDLGYDIKSLLNPFSDHLSFELIAPAEGNGVALFTLVDMYGRVIRQETAAVSQGLNPISLYGLTGLSNGTYALQAQYAGKMITKKVVKGSN